MAVPVVKLCGERLKIGPSMVREAVDQGQGFRGCARDGHDHGTTVLGSLLALSPWNHSAGTSMGVRRLPVERPREAPSGVSLVLRR